MFLSISRLLLFFEFLQLNFLNFDGCYPTNLVDSVINRKLLANFVSKNNHFHKSEYGYFGLVDCNWSPLPLLICFLGNLLNLTRSFLDLCTYLIIHQKFCFGVTGICHFPSNVWCVIILVIVLVIVAIIAHIQIIVQDYITRAQT